MPDESRAADEHALMAEITEPLANLPEDPVPIASDVDFPLVLRGYDRLAVDAYVRRTSELVSELQSTRSPDAAIRRALERVGEQISGILQRAHETAADITATSRREAEERSARARREADDVLADARAKAEQITAEADIRRQELDADADRIWGERQRIVEDARRLGQELLAVAEAAGERFPPAATSEEDAVDEGATVAFGSELATTPYDADADIEARSESAAEGSGERSAEADAERRSASDAEPPA